MAQPWKFFRAGGVDQVQLQTGADLVRLGDLDQKLWIALACPLEGTEFDARTLALIDRDGDKRVRAPELIAAARWLGDVLSDVELLVQPGDSVPLSGISAQHPEGARVLATARRLLANLGKADAPALSFTDLDAGLAQFGKERFNGDGILTPAASPDPTLSGALSDAVAATAAPATDRSGDPGLTRELLAAFFEAVDQHRAWRAAGDNATVRPLGDATAAAFDAFSAVRAKVDDFFSRGRIAAYDPRALEAVNREQSEYLAIAAKDLDISPDELLRFPLAQVTGETPLSLTRALNPAWAAAVGTFLDATVKPLLGATTQTLTAAQWSDLSSKLAPFGTWLAERAGAAVAGLDDARLAALSDPALRASLLALFDEEDAAKPLAGALEDTERLVRYRRDFHAIATNFVNFRHFYARSERAAFQVGRLYIDRRTTDLCVAVSDAGKHATMAPLSGFYLVYCDLRNGKGDKRSIAAALTDGDVDNLMVGRNGVFYDRSGQDWDATVTKIVENPISVREAFWRPYKKFLRLIEEQMSKRAQAADEQANAKLATAAATTDAAASGTVPAPEAPKKLDIGVVAAIGVAVGGLVAAFGAILQAFFGLGIWMPLGIVGLMLVISGPSMAIAYLKLRKRNLGPLLDANGWAVGAMARVNIKLGKSLTELAALPKGAERNLVDPFADKKRPWWLYTLITVVLVLGVLWFIGRLDGCLPNSVKSTEVLGESAPAALIEAKNKPAPEAPAAPAPAAEPAAP